VTPAIPPTQINPHLLYALNLINQARAALGLPPYVLDPALTACALQHSIDFDHAAGGQLANVPFAVHGDFKAGNTCGALAENQGVASGPDIDAAFKTVFDQMMAEGPAPTGSCNHYAALMSAQFTRIGIGEYYDPANGFVWITELFR
jgi:hypothetical protein